MSDPASKRLLMISNFLHDGKSSAAVGEGIALHLEKHGWKTICVSHYRNPILKLFEMVSTIVLQGHKFHAAQLDLFSGNAFFWAEVSSFFLALCGLPFIITLHGGSLPRFSKANPQRVRRVLARAKLVTAPSAYLKEALQEYTKHEIEILPNPLDLARITPKVRNRAGATLVWLRALEKVYNVTMAVDVIHALLPDFPEIRLLIVGPDKGDGTKEQLLARIAEHKLNDRIELVGPVPKAEVPDWLNKGDIFLNTTRVDNTPVSVLEAAACGLCIVTTNVGGIPYMFASSGAAILVDNERADQMVEAVRRILTSPELARSMSTAAIELTRSLDYSSVCEVWDARLRSIGRNRKN